MKKNLSIIAAFAVLFFLAIWVGFVELSAVPVFLFFAISGMTLRYSVDRYGHPEIDTIKQIYQKIGNGIYGVLNPVFYMHAMRDYTAIIVAAMFSAALLGGIFIPRSGPAVSEQKSDSVRTTAKPVSQHLGNFIQSREMDRLSKPCSESAIGETVLRYDSLNVPYQAESSISYISRGLGQVIQDTGEYRCKAGFLRESRVALEREYSSFYASWRWRPRRVLHGHIDLGGGKILKDVGGQYQQAGYEWKSV